jgi:hypothetical protein
MNSLPVNVMTVSYSSKFRNLITVHAHKSAKKYHRLEDGDFQRGTVEDLLTIFQTSKWISKVAFEKRSIELRFIFNEADVVRTW